MCARPPARTPAGTPARMHARMHARTHARTMRTFVCMCVHVCAHILRSICMQALITLHLSVRNSTSTEYISCVSSSRSRLARTQLRHTLSGLGFGAEPETPLAFRNCIRNFIGNRWAQQDGFSTQASGSMDSAHKRTSNRALCLVGLLSSPCAFIQQLGLQRNPYDDNTCHRESALNPNRWRTPSWQLDSTSLRPARDGSKSSNIGVVVRNYLH